MVNLPRVAVAFLSGLLAVQAAPAFDSTLNGTAKITPLTTSQIDAFTPYTYFASAAYCGLSEIQNWTCGGTASHL